MAVKIIIERTMTADDQAEVAELLKQLRAKAMDHQGYVSGETLFSVDRPGTHVVISTWERLRDWRAWEKDPQRGEIVQNVEALLASPSSTSVYTTSPRAIAEGV